MGRWDRTDAQEQDIRNRGIDSDLDAAMEYNPQPYQPEDIERVLAVVPGEHDGPDWHWILKLKQPHLVKDMHGNEIACQYVYARGGCDYTGWD